MTFRGFIVLIRITRILLHHFLYQDKQEHLEHLFFVHKILWILQIEFQVYSEHELQFENLVDELR